MAHIFLPTIGNVSNELVEKRVLLVITIKNIARELNISTSTVSRAIRNHPNINAATRARVLEACKRLNYVPNLSARSLVNKDGPVVGFMIPDIADTFFSGSAFGVEEILTDQGIEIFYFSTSRSPEKVRQFLISAVERRFAGVFITPDQWDKELIEILKTIPIPVVSLRRKPPSSVGIAFVDADHFGGGRQAVTHLHDLGHRRIAFIGLPTVVGGEREGGYLERMRDYGLSRCVEYAVSSGRLFRELDEGKRAARVLLSRDPSITAIFAANDQLAIGALTYLSEQNIAVPGDISVIGFDNLDFAELHWVQLTTIEQPRREIGRKAGELLVSMIKKNEKPQSAVLATVVIKRNSTGPATR